MAMANATGGFDVDRLLNFEKRTGVKDGEIETFITKVDAVNAAIQAMKDGNLDPSDVHVEGVPTPEEEERMAQEKRRKRLDMERRQQETRERQKREENEKWWRGAELLYGNRVPLNEAGTARQSYPSTGAGEGRDGGDASRVPATRTLSAEEKLRLKERYSMEYCRWDTWTPQDPATLFEEREREEEEEQKLSKEFEDNNPEFCSKMVDDMKVRSEARQKKESEANAARLKGNRFYKAREWEKALELYMNSLRAGPYVVNTLANVAQTLIKLERWSDAVEFCHRALHVDPRCVKALSRRASAFVKLVEKTSTHATASTTSTCKRDLPKTGLSSDVIVVARGGGAVDLSNSETSTTDTNSRTEDETAAFWEQYGGREGLLSLALADLSAAVGIDPQEQDVRRQRDDLKKEIEEEKAEADVMKRARTVGRCVDSGPSEKNGDQDPPQSSETGSVNPGDDRNLEMTGAQNGTPDPLATISAAVRSSDRERESAPTAEAGELADHGAADDELVKIDRLLEKALSKSGEAREANNGDNNNVDRGVENEGGRFTEL